MVVNNAVFVLLPTVSAILFEYWCKYWRYFSCAVSKWLSAIRFSHFLAIFDTNSVCYQRQKQDAGKDDAGEQVAKYMSDTSSELSSLSAYPSIKQWTVNTILPASPAVERLFSLGARLLTTAIKDVKWPLWNAGILVFSMMVNELNVDCDWTKCAGYCSNCRWHYYMKSFHFADSARQYIS